MGKSCAIVLKGSRFESGWATVNFFHCVFQFLQNSMSTIKSSSQVPHQSFRAQTAVLLSPTSYPWYTVPDFIIFHIHLSTFQLRCFLCSENCQEEAVRLAWMRSFYSQQCSS